MKNYHTHTARCHHAMGTDEDYVQIAIQEGYTTLGFSDHACWHYPSGFHPHIRMLETEFDEEFRQWILDFPKDQLPIIYQLLEKYGQNRNVHIFRSRDAAENYLKENFSKNKEKHSI